MERLKTFLKKRALLMGTLAVAIPLVFIIFWQYRSLKSLEKTLPVYRKAVMRDYLNTVTETTFTFYRDNALDALSLSPDDITNRIGGEIQVKDTASLLASVQRVGEPFAATNIKGVRRFFLVVDTTRNGDQNFILLISFSDITSFSQIGMTRGSPDSHHARLHLPQMTARAQEMYKASSRLRQSYHLRCPSAGK